MNCRHCDTTLTHTFLDLGFAPPSNAYLTEKQLSLPEKYYPLKVRICDKCWLAQTEDYAEADELFSPDYAYFSSTSTGWLRHAEEYCKTMTEQLNLTDKSMVIEVASNDGYLLKNFVQDGIPCLGIEPTASTAAAAEKLSIPVLREFFGEQLAERLAADGKQADLIIGNNVYAHVPDINDFTKGLKAALKPEGTITLEFPHLLQMVENNQFDTIYHEHFSYLSFYTVKQIFESAGLEMFDVEEIPTHGGSLRIYAKHRHDGSKSISQRVGNLIKKELAAGMDQMSFYEGFRNKAERIKFELLEFLLKQKKEGKKVACYGAAAKGNTLLNYCGVKSDLIDFVIDANPHKQNKYLPASHIPVYGEEHLKLNKPDFVIILPWNIKNEIVSQLNYIKEWSGKFVVAIPEVSVIN